MSKNITKTFILLKLIDKNLPVCKIGKNRKSDKALRAPLLGGWILYSLAKPLTLNPKKLTTLKKTAKRAILTQLKPNASKPQTINRNKATVTIR